MSYNSLPGIKSSKNVCRKCWVKIFIAITFIVLALPLQSFSRPGKKVILQLKWKHQFQFAGYYAAVEKGYYAQEDLDVELRELPQSGNVITEVLEGRAQFGIANADIIIHYLNGAPVVVLAPIFQSSPAALVSRADRNITRPLDIAGKTIEINAKKSGSVEVLTMLSLEGVKPSQYQVTETSLSLNKLLNNQTDVSEVYLTNEPYFLEKFGIPYNLILPHKYGVDFYAECLFTTNEMISKNPELVDAFLRATIKGWEYALENSEEIAQVIQSKYKTTKTLDHLIFESQKVKEFIQPNFINIGHSNKGRWLQMMETLLQAGLINKTKPIDDLLYNPRQKKHSPFTDKWFILVIGTILLLTFLLHFWYINRVNKRKQQLVNIHKQQVESLKQEILMLNSHLEETVQRNKDLESFKESLLSNFSFEIRTPLNNIIGYSELLNDPKIKPTQALQFSKEINKSCRLLQNQIDNLIDLSKLESNQFRLVYQRINLTELLNTLQIMLLNELKLFDKEHIAIKAFIDPNEIDFDILSDRNLFKSIFQRLINNAVKFTAKGYIEIGIRKSEKNGHLLFWIQDSGIGMDIEKAKTVFNRLNIDESGDGFGILKMGLPVVKGIVDLLNGRIWIETAEGTGATINIEVPYTPIGSHKARTSQKKSPFYIHQNPPKLKNKKILIVEDIQSNFILLSRLLEETGCQLEHAKTGEEALKKVENTPNFDLIFMDLRLTDMDGIEITRQIRKKNTKVVIVAQTAYSSGVKVNMSIEAGCNDFITKPISRIDLYNVLRKYLVTDDRAA
jgi:signal transduction histidine kinase/ABC-type nitrate/sulfonate/bicarbonate transport system substrate-binding protein/CheY-like chemotaxis protein